MNEIAKWKTALGDSISVMDRKLSLVAIIRDESEYIEEWLEFHFLLGVSHIYLYDNESQDSTKEKLQKYIGQGLVTYIWWPGPAAQLPAYNHAIENFKYESTYIGFIDADEFLMPAQDVDLCQTIDETFALATECLAYSGGACGGIGVNWRMYGTSFHTDKPDGLVIENYQYRAPDRYNENGHIKTICNPRVVAGFERNPHCVRYLDGFYCASENGSYIPDAFFYDGICCRLRINHYYSKSEAELAERLKKGKARQNDIKPSEEEIAQRICQVKENFNEVYDPAAWRYVDDVKRRMGCGSIE